MSTNNYINTVPLFRKEYHCRVKILAILFLMLLIIPELSCKKLIEVDPPTTSINSANVFASDATAISLLTGIYTRMSQTSNYFARGITTISLFSGLSADELKLYSGLSDGSYIACYTNGLTVLNIGTANFWSKIYPYILITNTAIEELAKSHTLTPGVKQQLIGEAKFIRAFCYFYLVNLYGDVPLAISSDYTVNAVLVRSSKAQVYQQIITDLKDAQELLTIGYVDGSVINSTTERVRPNKWAASALLARAYLYSGDYVNAEAQATAVLNYSTLYNLNTLTDVFKMNSTEAIWQLQPVFSGRNTEDARLFILSSAPSGLSVSHPVFLSSFLVNTFETGDNRKINWANNYTDGTGTYYYPYKYKSATIGDPVTEYLMVLRLGEQYLIRAEARAQQDNISGAKSDLNAIRTRAGLANTTANDKASLLTAILHERQVELFTEWGHRWFDLKRTATVNAVMSVITPQKGGTWSTNWQLYPVPLLELQRDPNLVQNAGY